MPASFTHADGSVVFSRAPLRPDNSLAPRQPSRKSAGGVRYAYTAIIEDDLISLRLRMNDAELEQLILFWHAIVNGMVKPFTYTPIIGPAIGVCFNTPDLPDLIEKAYDNHQVTVALRRL